MSALQKDVLTKNLPPLPHRTVISRDGGVAGGPKRGRRDYSPLPWSDFFDRQEDVVASPGNCFRVYSKGSSGPILLLLHGGGHSALSWAVFSVAVSKRVECEVIAVDLRSHGESSCGDEGDLSAGTLVGDVGAITEAVTRDRDHTPPIILMGHSMGGAIAARAAAGGVVKSLVGLVVIDVVEGTAIDSLGSMQGFLRDRPSHFKSLDTAVEWSIRSGQLRNVESARVSMPGQVRSAGKDEGTSDLGSVPQPPQPSSSLLSSQPLSLPVNTIQEEEGQSEQDSTTNFPKPPAAPGKYVWRVNLVETERHWQGWFEGLSQLFLSIPVPKMLILAGVDRLDKQLTIAQMQGKFEMQVMSGCGHSVHEDAPDKVAEVVSYFLIRHKFAAKRDQDTS